MKHSAFRNSQESFLSDSLAGFIAQHPDATWHDAGFIGRSTHTIYASWATSARLPIRV